MMYHVAAMYIAVIYAASMYVASMYLTSMYIASMYVASIHVLAAKSAGEGVVKCTCVHTAHVYMLVMQGEGCVCMCEWVGGRSHGGVGMCSSARVH